MSNLKIHGLFIDPQNDFMDSPGAALPVPGANADMSRLATMIGRIGRKLDDIHVTLDSHRKIDVGHPGMWKNADGKSPAPFTIISADDLRNGIWAPRNPAFARHFITSVEALEKGGKYPLMVWPEHCLIGTPGHNVQADLMAALLQWEHEMFANVDFVTKGSNAFVEHYGALMAEVPFSKDPSTLLNTAFLQMLSEADIIAVAGEASSHCVKETVTQIADNIGEEHIKKFHLLMDCMSPVPAIPGGPDFPAIAQAWMETMQKRGMTLTTSTTFLA